MVGISYFRKVQKCYIKGSLDAFANTHVELVREKTIREKTIKTNEVDSIESLLNHADLNDEVNNNNPLNTKIREGMYEWIKSTPANIIKVKKFWNIKIRMLPDWLQMIIGNK